MDEKQTKTTEPTAAELSVHDLEGVTGAGIMMNAEGAFEVIDDTNGSVIATFWSLQDADAYATENGYDLSRLSWQELAELRAGDNC